MNLQTIKKTMLALTPIAMVAAISCSSTDTDDSMGASSAMVAYQPGVPGGVAVETYETTATVKEIDRASRKLTLEKPDGSKIDFKAGPEVRNFDQIKVGDRVKATAAEELVVFLRKAGSPGSADGSAAALAVAPKGAKPGVLMADTVQVSAKVVALDPKLGTATLRFPDGRTKTIKVRPDVDMAQAKIGDEVVIRSTEAMAIIVEKR